MVKALFKNIKKDDQRYTTYNMLITFHHSLAHPRSNNTMNCVSQTAAALAINVPVPFSIETLQHYHNKKPRMCWMGGCCGLRQVFT